MGMHPVDRTLLRVVLSGIVGRSPAKPIAPRSSGIEAQLRNIPVGVVFDSQP